MLAMTASSVRSGRSRRARAGCRRGAAMAIRWMIALVEHAVAIATVTAFSKACGGDDLPASGPPRPSRRCGGRMRSPCAGGRRRRRGSRRRRERQAHGLGDRGHRRGGAHGHAVAGQRAIPPSIPCQFLTRRSCRRGARPSTCSCRCRSRGTCRLVAAQHRAGGQETNGRPIVTRP